MQSVLFENIIKAINWNPHIYPFSLKLDTQVNITDVNHTTDVNVLSDAVLCLAMDLTSSSKLMLYVYEFKLRDQIYLFDGIGYTYEAFCNEMRVSIEDNKEPHNYCIRCMKECIRPERDKVVEAIQKWNDKKELMKVLQ